MIGHITQAVNFVTDEIRSKGYDVIGVKYVNSKRHAIISTNEPSKSRYYVIYKRDFFFSYGKIFNKVGIGESINEECLRLAMSEKADRIIVVYKSDVAYSITPTHWMYQSNQDNTIRTTSNGEKTYCISVRTLRRWSK